MHELAARVAVSPQWGFTFIRIPKAANSTVAVALQQRFPQHAAPDSARASHSFRRIRPGSPASSYRRAKHTFTPLTSLSTVQVEEMLANHFVFTVVRNPFHRVLSAYLQKFTADRYRDAFADEVVRFGNGDLSFNAFCRWLRDGGGLNRNPHWTPQSRIIGLIGHDRLDLIGRVESLDEDLARIVARISCDNGLHPCEQPAAFTASGPTPTHARAKAREYYDDECMAIIVGLYHDDFRKLGYADDVL